MIYLDNAATTPLLPEVLEAMLPYLSDTYGNPSSLHAQGRGAKAALEAARRTVAEAIGALPEEITFTSGGTEADNWAIRGIAGFAAWNEHKKLLIGATEHHAVLESAQSLEREGYTVDFLAVDSLGRIDLSAAADKITPDTALVSIMLANNETGTLQPIRELSALCKAAGVPLHTDAVQAVGHIPVHVDDLGVELLSLSAHKMGGPKGVGALYVRNGTDIRPLQTGGGQEGSRRGGTENLPGIVGFAKAISLATADMQIEQQRLWRLRKRLLRGIRQSLPDAVFHGHPEYTLPGIVSLSIPGVRSEGMLMLLDIEGVAVSAGAACAAGLPEPTHVLKAMGVPLAELESVLRISMGRCNDEEQIDTFIRLLYDVVKRLTKQS